MVLVILIMLMVLAILIILMGVATEKHAPNEQCPRVR
jgi:hypothetical protein